jgi:hypothetical protein
MVLISVPPGPEPQEDHFLDPVDGRVIREIVIVAYPVEDNGDAGIVARVWRAVHAGAPSTLAAQHTSTGRPLLGLTVEKMCSTIHGSFYS